MTPDTQPIFGSMRLGSLSEASCTNLLAYIIEQGGRRFHSSFEYGTFQKFSASLLKACNRTGVESTDLKHVVKLATPHFDENKFSAADLSQTLERYLNELQCNTIDIIQWMVRIDLKREEERINCLRNQNEEIETAVATLKKSESIHRFGCFPYTRTFCDQVITYDWCDVILDYYNPMENLDFPFDSLRDDQAFIGIRPFFPVLQNNSNTVSITHLMDFALKPEPNESLILSVSSEKNANEIFHYFNNNTRN